MSKILLVLALFVMGHAQELTPTQASKLKNYNHSLSGKMRYKKLLQKTAIINKDKAYSMCYREICSCWRMGSCKKKSKDFKKSYSSRKCVLFQNSR